MARTSLLGALVVAIVVVEPLAAQGLRQDVRFRSGNIVVQRSYDWAGGEAAPIKLDEHRLLRDQIDFGCCFEDPKYRRMPITYYHPQGPAGLALQRFNWFPGGVNTYHADARLPASLVGLTCPTAATNLPLESLLSVWSEPPVAVIGLNAGTTASYARPFQHFHFYEPNKELIKLNWAGTFFHFLRDANARGAEIRIVEGSPRQKLREHGPRRFYHLMIMEACSGDDGEKLFLDLFTKEGIAQCLEHLTADGVLLVHTSHRFIDLPPVLAAIGADLKLNVRRGFDQAPGNPRWRGGGEVGLAEIGHYTSEWVLLARNPHIVEAICQPPTGYAELLKKNPRPFGNVEERYWSTPKPLDHVWTDKGPNLLHGILRGHPSVMRYQAVVIPCTHVLVELLPLVGLGHPAIERWVLDWSRPPQVVEDLLVRQQLQKNPEVEKLWR